MFDGYIQSPTGAAHTWWQHLSHGFQLGAVLQYYSALPLNILSGVNTVQQTGGRPCAGLAATAAACTLNAMIGRNAGEGFDFFNVSSRLSRTFAVGERVRVQAMAEAFNLLNHRNDMVPNTTFGSGVFPDVPRSTFGQATAVGEPRTLQLALRVAF